MIIFREETRWLRYYYRGDFTTLDETNWKCITTRAMTLKKRMKLA